MEAIWKEQTKDMYALCFPKYSSIQMFTGLAEEICSFLLGLVKTWQIFTNEPINNPPGILCHS